VSRAQPSWAVMDRGFAAHMGSAPFFTLLDLMKIPLRAKKNAAMVRLALEPPLMAAFTYTIWTRCINVMLLLLLSITTSLHEVCTSLQAPLLGVCFLCKECGGKVRPPVPGGCQ